MHIHTVTCFKLTSSQTSVSCDLSQVRIKSSTSKVEWRLEALAFQCDPAVPTQQWKTHCSALQENPNNTGARGDDKKEFLHLAVRLHVS